MRRIRVCGPLDDNCMRGSRVKTMVYVTFTNESFVPEHVLTAEESLHYALQSIDIIDHWMHSSHLRLFLFSATCTSIIIAYCLLSSACKRLLTINSNDPMCNVFAKVPSLRLDAPANVNVTLYSIHAFSKSVARLFLMIRSTSHLANLHSARFTYSERARARPIDVNRKTWVLLRFATWC